MARNTIPTTSTAAAEIPIPIPHTVALPAEQKCLDSQSYEMFKPVETRELKTRRISLNRVPVSLKISEQS